MGMRITGGEVLLPDGLVAAPMTLADGVIGVGGAAGLAEFDARGLWVLPGVIDLHGDAFERQVQPRPGVAFDAGLALADTEAQLLANGITTAFHAVTLSWEPGLRSPAAWRSLLDALGARRWSCDMRVHMRWEMHNLDALDMALADIRAGRVHLVSFNDHTPSIVRKLGTPAGAAKFSERAMMGVDAFRALAAEAFARAPEVPEAAARVAEAAAMAGLPMASHDDATVAARERFRALGATICEFPMAEPVAREARAAGEAVVMGCPNVVRGGSHLGWAGAQAMVERGLCSVLVSDYFYPAMVQAALRLAGPLGLAAAWATISANPADAAGLHDRGRIAPGLRGDLVAVEPESGRVVATFVAGEPAYLSHAGWRRLQQG